MKLKYIALCLPLLLTACGEKTEPIGCSSDVTQISLIEALKKTTLEEISRQTSHYSDVTNQLKRTTLEEISFNVSEIMTKANDPNSTMKSCSAMVSMTIPANNYETLHDYYRTEFNSNLDKTLETLSLEQNANTFSARIDYSAQPTDDNKTVFVNIASKNSISNGAAFVSTLSIVKPIKEQQRILQQQQEQELQKKQEELRQQQELNRQKQLLDQQAEQESQRQQALEQQEVRRQRQALQQEEQEIPQLSLSQAKQDFLSADAELNNRWQSLSSEQRKALLLGQRQWIKNKDLICGKVTSQGSDAELAKIYNCHAETIKNRIPDLK
ncbi:MULTISPECIES: lysozyme inhibitor LprI family protein [Gammaproteobacteria]|uniref:lysozyme inhibitor LprI family protein n=1 Tax=Gammaproteobacteria TaxID=1236 RepID=UPI0018680506|nr:MULTISPECIES: lysozyme inhibitor LprI family protein [Gammaproteobacteria]